MVGSANIVHVAPATTTTPGSTFYCIPFVLFLGHEQATVPGGNELLDSERESCAAWRNVLFSG